ncbi:MAG TPA: hypothetical protein PKM84_00955 [Candidatus Pacearchaeota archaeon]|nr:hypothetical protein [Candidatus Pacearchaeota archaeon]
MASYSNSALFNCSCKIERVIGFGDNVAEFPTKFFQSKLVNGNKPSDIHHMPPLSRGGGAEIKVDRELHDFYHRACNNRLHAEVIMAIIDYYGWAQVIDRPLLYDTLAMIRWLTNTSKLEKEEYKHNYFLTPSERRYFKKFFDYRCYMNNDPQNYQYRLKIKSVPDLLNILMANLWDGAKIFDSRTQDFELYCRFNFHLCELQQYQPNRINDFFTLFNTRSGQPYLPLQEPRIFDNSSSF